MERIKIAQFDIEGMKEIIDNSVQIKQNIDELKEAQKQLTKEGKTASKEFVQNAADLKLLNREYNANIKVISDANKKVAEQESRQKLLNIALNQEIKSVNDARASNKLLNKLRNETNVTTKEGQAELKKLNDQLDANNEFIKENSDAYARQKINIGNYASGIRDAFDVNSLLENGLKGTIKNVIGLTKASLAFIATPLGAVLAVVAGALALVKNALNRSEESSNKLSAVWKTLGGVLSRLLGFLEPVGEFLIDGIVMGFELAGKAAQFFLDTISFTLVKLGFDEAAKSVKNFNTEISNSAKEAKDLAIAEAELVKQQRNFATLQLDFQRRAERQRQIRDDETKSISERKAASEELASILQRQSKIEEGIAIKALNNINRRIALEGESSDLLDKRAEALEKFAEVQERIEGQESEQLTSNVSLSKEAVEVARELSQQKIEGLEQEFALLQEKRRFDEDNIQKQREFANEEIKILKEKLNAKLISETEYNSEKLRIENEIKAKQLEDFDKEIEQIELFEERKKSLQDEIRLKNAEDEKERALIKAELDLEKEIAELNKLELTEDQKTKLIRLAEENRGLVVDEIRKRFSDKQLSDFKDAMDKDLEIRQKNADAAAGVAFRLGNILKGILGDSLGAQLAGIAIDAAIQAAKVGITTSAAKAANLAQATASAPPPFNLPFIGQAISQNAILTANSAKAISSIIASASLNAFGTIAREKFSEGGEVQSGLLTGKRHSQGGIPIEAEGGEYIFSRKTVENLGVPFLNRLNFGNPLASVNTSGHFVDGGLVGRSISGSSVNVNEVSELIRESIGNLKVINVASETEAVLLEQAIIVENASTP